MTDTTPNALPTLYDDTREILGTDDPLAAEVGEMLERFGDRSTPG